MKGKRLYFIDTVRAFAILMMLQGHFIDALLAPSYKDVSDVSFQVWDYFRGITAPTFFTISGLIFTYLLLKSKQQETQEKRMRKGLARGAMLIGIGYALRVQIFDWLGGQFHHSIFIIDVLQCIGFSLITLVISYQLNFRKTFFFSISMLVLGSTIFITEPLYRDLNLSDVPIFFSNYVSKTNGSVFTLLPWLGYVFFGGFIATLFHWYSEQPGFKLAIITTFFSVGLLLILKSSWLFHTMYELTDILLLKDVAYFNYLFSRLGDVLVLLGVFYIAETYIKQQLILKIGQQTLSIYVIHFILLYGSFTGIGLEHLIGKNLTPWQAITGALLFIAVVCLISLGYEKTNPNIYIKIRGTYKKIKSRRNDNN